MSMQHALAMGPGLVRLAIMGALTLSCSSSSAPSDAVAEPPIADDDSIAGDDGSAANGEIDGGPIASPRDASTPEGRDASTRPVLDGAVREDDAGERGHDAGESSVDASTPGSDAGSEPEAPPPPWEGFAPTGPGYTVTTRAEQSRGVWEGFGTSLAWWAQGVGGSAYEALYADLFFTRRNVRFREQTLPGLGLTIVRYNVGGGGRPGDITDLKENVPDGFEWFKDLDGFELDWLHHDDPTSPSWDFSRDAAQRSMLSAALSRGVTDVELFANAPMWWMTHEKSSAGGRLQDWNRRDFANYLATVTAHAQATWTSGARLSVEPFNEPSAGWWNYPKNQEGCNLGADAQAEILGALREGLDARDLTGVTLSASDENTMVAAARTLGDLTIRSAMVSGKTTPAADLVGKVNVHAYNGLDPWRDNNARTALRTLVGSRRLWMSEYGDPDGSGMTLAQTITEDLTYLKPTAWVYWQAAEPWSGWGLVNGSYGESASQPDRAAPSWVYTKYFVFAQFTRFVRPGMTLLENDDHNSVAAFDATQEQLNFVTVNYGNAQVITYDLSMFAEHGAAARVTYTETNGAHVFTRFDAPIVEHRVQIPARANALYSIAIDGVVR